MKVVLTGGGTAGHVSPNLALLPALRARGDEVLYAGSRDGIERRLAGEAGLPYYAVHTGKLRRYLSLENLIDPFRIVLGIFEAALLLRRLAPDVVFSKGGFVAVPVVVGAWLNRIPVAVHESDLTPGLANRLSFPLARRICLSFRETAAAIPDDRGVYTGTPIRPALLEGDRIRGIERFRLTADRKTVFVFGGSQGAQAINDLVRAGLESSSSDVQVLHVCGPGNLDSSLDGRDDYRQYEYLDAEFADAFACADVVVSRAGANSLAEIIALRKPAVVVPLPTAASRGDQIDNARLFAEKGYGLVARQEQLTPQALREKIDEALERSSELIAAMERAEGHDPVERVLAVLDEIAGADRDGRLPSR